MGRLGGIAGFGSPVASLRAPSLQAVLWWTLAIVNAGLAAALVWAVVTPVSPLGNWQAPGVRIVPPAKRAALFASLDPFNRALAPAGAAASGSVTSLSLVLFATRSAPGGGGSAIIAGADGVQQVYRTGAEVMPGVTLAAVGFDHVELTRNGAREQLYIDQSSPAPSAEGLVANHPVASPVLPSGGALTVDAARAGIGFGPRAEGGRIAGIEVIAQGNGQAFRAAGFEPGDVITTVGGKPITGAADTALLAGALRPGGSVSVTVKRGNRVLPLAISLAP